MGYVPAAVDQNAIGVACYIGQYLRAFMEDFRTDGEDATLIVVRVNGGGGYDSRNPRRRGHDGMTYPIPNIYYSTEAACRIRPRILPQLARLCT